MKAKKQIKKLENRIERIEKELARNSSFTLSKDVLRGITDPKLEDVLVKSTPYVEEEKPFVLPEKWFLRVTDSNREFLSNWQKSVRISEIIGLGSVVCNHSDGSFWIAPPTTIQSLKYTALVFNSSRVTTFLEVLKKENPSIELRGVIRRGLSCFGQCC